jgi:hypothetical protein
VRFKAEDIKAEFDKMTMGQNGTKSVLLSFDISLYRGLCNVKIIGSDTSR